MNVPALIMHNSSLHYSADEINYIKDTVTFFLLRNTKKTYSGDFFLIVLCIKWKSVVWSVLHKKVSRTGLEQHEGD